jgi:hypothetical protein
MMDGNQHFMSHVAASLPPEMRLLMKVKCVPSRLSRLCRVCPTFSLAVCAFAYPVSVLCHHRSGNEERQIPSLSLSPLTSVSPSTCRSDELSATLCAAR